MKIPIDPDSPVPLYHQIADSLRYTIATGKLEPGASLPAVRDAGVQWGVHLHTVRRAYRVLADEGLLEIRGALGTRVSPDVAIHGGGRSSVRAFLERMVRRAHDDYGLSPTDLARHLLSWPHGSWDPRPSFSFVECSAIQAAGHAEEIASTFDVALRPFSLEERGEPPAGVIVSTYFHHNEVRLRWPHRIRDFHFVAILPAPELEESLGRNGTLPRKVLLIEKEESMVRNVAADLAVLFGDEGPQIETHLLADAEKALDLPGRSPLLFTPRMWATLSERARQSPRVHEVRYVIDPIDLATLAREFSWSPRRHQTRKQA